MIIHLRGLLILLSLDIIPGGWIYSIFEDTYQENVRTSYLVHCLRGLVDPCNRIESDPRQR